MPLSRCESNHEGCEETAITIADRYIIKKELDEVKSELRDEIARTEAKLTATVEVMNSKANRLKEEFNRLETRVEEVLSLLRHRVDWAYVVTVLNNVINQTGFVQAKLKVRCGLNSESVGLSAVQLI